MTANLRLVEQFVDAFNRHDVDGMLALVHDDIEWLSLTGAEAAVEARGKAELGRSMKGYFNSVPSVRSVVTGALDGPRFVAVRERVRWESKSGEKSQFAIAVYAVEDGRA